MESQQFQFLIGQLQTVVSLEQFFNQCHVSIPYRLATNLTQQMGLIMQKQLVSIPYRLATNDKTIPETNTF